MCSSMWFLGLTRSTNSVCVRVCACARVCGCVKVFQFTTFTTVGYGTHPRNFESDQAMVRFCHCRKRTSILRDDHTLNCCCMFVCVAVLGQLLTVFYILSGMVIMGILAGAIGQKLLFAVGNLIERVELVVLLAADCIQEKVAKRIAQSEQAVADAASAKRYSPVKALLGSFASMAVIFGVGTLGYMEMDGMTATKALYFTVVTVTTVGFGDIHPTSAGAKLFSLVFVPVGVIFFAKAMTVISNIPIRNRAAKLEAYVLNQFLRRLTTYDLNALQRSVDLQEGAPITKNDFCLAVLLRLGSVSPDDLERIEAIFFALDRDRCAQLILHCCTCSRRSW